MVEYKKYLKTLILSTALAFLMLYIALGLMFFAQGGEVLSKPYVLLILAVFFVIFTKFYGSEGSAKKKRKGKESYTPLLKGLFLAISATFAFVSIAGGVKFMVDWNIQEIVGIEAFISALAICMIVSMVFLSLLKPSEFA